MNLETEINAMDYDFGEISSISKVNGNKESRYAKDLLELYKDKPSFVSDEVWDEYHILFPWLYHRSGKMFCLCCEEAFKLDKGLLPTIWTKGDVPDNDYQISRYNKTRTRFERHYKTHNHLLAEDIMNKCSLTEDWSSLCAKYTWLQGNMDNTRCSVCEQAYKQYKKSMIVTIWTCPELKKQDPVSLFSAEHKLDRHEKCKNHLLAVKLMNTASPETVTKRSRKSVPVKQTTMVDDIGLPISISIQQYRILQSRYPWLMSRDSTSLSCELCENSVIQLDANSNLQLISRRILAHSHTDEHIRTSLAGLIDTRTTTRLQHGVGPKIDYKRLSSGLDHVTMKSEHRGDTGRWSCPQCYSLFVDTTNLIEHISLCDYRQSTETAVRQLSCPCTTSHHHYDTITKVDLHAAQDHSDQPLFHCYICSDRFTRLLGLYGHMLVHHLIVWDPFEAYAAVDTVSHTPVLTHDCMFCSLHLDTNTELTEHYQHSQCSQYLQPTIVIEPLATEHTVRDHDSSDILSTEDASTKTPASKRGRKRHSSTRTEVSVVKETTLEETPQKRLRKGLFLQIMSALVGTMKPPKSETLVSEIQPKDGNRRTLFAQKRLARVSASNEVTRSTQKTEMTKKPSNRRSSLENIRTFTEEEHLQKLDIKKPIKKRISYLKDNKAELMKTPRKLNELKGPTEESKKTSENSKEMLEELKVTEEESNVTEEESKINEENSTRTDEESNINEEYSKGTEDESKIHEDDSKGTEEESKRNEEDSKGTEEESKRNEEDSKGTEEESKRNEEDSKGTEEESKIHEDDSKGTEEESKRNDDDSKGTEEESKRNEEDSKGTEEESKRNEEDSKGTEEESKETDESKVTVDSSTKENFEIITFDQLAKMHEELAKEKYEIISLDREMGETDYKSTHGISLSELKICLEKTDIIVANNKRRRVPSEKLRESQKFFSTLPLANEKRIRVPSEKLRVHAGVDIEIRRRGRPCLHKTKSIELPLVKKLQQTASAEQPLKIRRRSRKRGDSLDNVKRSLKLAKRMRKSLGSTKTEHAEPKVHRTRSIGSMKSATSLNGREVHTPSVDPLKLRRSIMIKSQLSPSPPIDFTVTTDEEYLPAELSFMDRMKRIRQLKKIRTEQQREQMMAVDKTVAEINEKVALSDATISAKSDRIKQLLHCEQYSMNDLKNILQTTKRHQLDNDEYKPRRKKKPKIDTSRTARVTPFVCDACQRKFQSLCSRDKHMLADHRGLKMFKCRVCSYTLATYVGLRKHAHKQHPTRVALAIFGKENNQHDEQTRMQCQFCAIHFTSKSAMNHHVTSVHRAELDEQRSATDIVGLASPVVVVDDFVENLKEANPISNPQECPICNDMMDNEFELAIHTIEHERERDPEMEANQFACPKCCRLFFGREGKTYLKDHYNIIHLQKPVPSCDECRTEFPSTWCYYEHKRLVKHCTKKTSITESVTISDPYDDLNNQLRLAFVCSRCQTLVAGQSAQLRFDQHLIECSLQLADESPSLIMAIDKS